MKNMIFYSLFLLMMVISSQIECHAALAQQEVNQYMTQLESATQQRDYLKVGEMMAPEIEIQFHLNSQKELLLTRAQYIQNALSSASSYSNYLFKSKVQSIKTNGNKAMVTYTSYEKATSKEQGTIYCVIKGIAVLEKRNGKLSMTKLGGVGQMSKTPLF